jgi:hypothetical protein
MKSIFPSVALLALCSCTTLKPSQPTDKVSLSSPDQATLQEWAKPFEYRADRQPSSEIVSKPVYFWEADSLKVPLTAGVTIRQAYNVRFSQYSSYEMKQKIERQVTTMETRWVSVTEEVLVCDEKMGHGKSEAWNAFYNGDGDKSVALDHAIQGIGIPTATKLIKAGYFHKKPTSWEDFENEVDRANAAGVITKDARYLIIYKYRSANMTKLGYNPQLTGVCKLVPESYLAPVERPVTRTVLVDEIVHHRDLISSESRQYEVRISGQRLQSFENEMLVFNFNHETNQVSLSSAAYNNYGIAFDGKVITVKGLSRKGIRLPEDALPRGATLEASGGQARFTAPLNRLYIPMSAAEGHLMGSIRIHSCKKGLLGACSLMKRDEQIQQTVVKDLLPNSALMTHTFAIAPKRIYWIEYWVNTANSPWYINNVVKSSSTPQI